MLGEYKLCPVSIGPMSNAYRVNPLDPDICVVLAEGRQKRNTPPPVLEVDLMILNHAYTDISNSCL